MYSFRNWTTLFPETSHTPKVWKMAMFLEKGYYERWNTFPHTISKYVKRSENYSPLKTTPLPILIVKDFTLRLLENENIGTDDNVLILLLLYFHRWIMKMVRLDLPHSKWKILIFISTNILEN